VWDHEKASPGRESEQNYRHCRRVQDLEGTMKANPLLAQARAVVSDCLQVKKGEQVLIVWDGTIGEELVSASQIALSELGADWYLLTYEPVAYRPVSEFCLFAGASLREGGFKIPPILQAGLDSCDASLLLISDMELLFAPKWADMLGGRGSNGGKRMVLLGPHTSTEVARRTLPRSREEVEELKTLVERCGEVIGKASHGRVRSDNGTDLSFDLGQYEVRAHTGVAKNGTLAGLPGGQVTRVPDDGSAQGTLVIDRSVAAPGDKALSEPITLKVKDGNVVSIEGGLEAKALDAFLQSLGTPSIYHLTELGIGTNRRCRLSGLGHHPEDTHTYGTVSFALGCDVHIGGQVRAPAHIDMTMRFPALSVDGRDVVRDGAIVLDSSL
jgi:2,5-dihydroxypyridine 5,6-dioxygenase